MGLKKSKGGGRGAGGREGDGKEAQIRMLLVLGEDPAPVPSVHDGGSQPSVSENCLRRLLQLLNKTEFTR